MAAERRLPYAPADLCALVGDVRAYPSFIPWIKDLKITGESQEGGVWQGIAHVIVGWKALVEKFATRVRSAPESGEVDVNLVSGPFRRLENAWRFASDGKGGAVVRFSITFEFKNPLLNAMARANADLAAARIMAAFEKEAARRLGGGGHDGDG